MGRTAEATRRRIIDAAYELFYRRGFARVGVDAVAAQAGVIETHALRALRQQGPAPRRHARGPSRASRSSASAAGRSGSPAMREAMVKALFAGAGDLGIEAALVAAPGSPASWSSWPICPGHPARAYRSATQTRPSKSRLTEELARRRVARRCAARTPDRAAPRRLPGAHAHPRRPALCRGGRAGGSATGRARASLCAIGLSVPPTAAAHARVARRASRRRARRQFLDVHEEAGAPGSCARRAQASGTRAARSCCGRSRRV
mgnify:CR=1 FL=1